MEKIRALEFKDDMLHLIDQTKLPLKEEWIVSDDYERISIAIERLEVRGAPAIGVASAFALALSIKGKQENRKEIFESAYKRLYSTRPTAVNLFYGLNEIKKVFEENLESEQLYQKLISRAIEIHNEDINMCERIAKNGLGVFTKKSRVLTHCNAGALATSGDGTAVNVIRYAFENGMVEFVHVDETRPLLQGSRLTAWELNKYGIPFSINTDSSAAVLMKEKKVDLVITGADRIAINGDAANKIGTYNLAVLCNHHHIPFYIAAPSSTFDKKCSSGEEIKIELRNKKELTAFGGKQITSDEYDAYCPAFDVTPNNLITAIITEKGIYKQPFDFTDV
jgi:methylthioribose-1-phosphate isomerase